MKTLAMLVCFSGAAMFAADAPGVAAVYDQQIKMIEGEAVSLVEAVPADKFDFAPTAGEFKGARTFAQQAKHTAAVNYMVAAAALGEKVPIEVGKDENGPASVKSKEQIVQFLKDSFAYARKAAATLTSANETEQIKSPFGSGTMPRVFAVNVAVWHSFDHYGQMVVYARMNGVIPPASRPRK